MNAPLYYLDAVLSDSNFELLLSNISKSVSNFSISHNHLKDIIIGKTDAFTLDEASLIAKGDFTVEKLGQVVQDIANEFICLEGKEFYVKDGKIISWKDYILNNGEDLFCCALLADKMRTNKIDKPRLDWPFCLSLDNSRLDKILSKGYSENHLHFNGSSPIFYLNWVSMNQALNVFDIKTKTRMANAKKCLEDQANEFFLWCQRGYILRRYLVYFLIKFSKTCLQSNSQINLASRDLIYCLKHLSNPGDMYSANIDNKPFLHVNLLKAKYDYAESLFRRKADSIECGERRLLYLCFLHFDEYPCFFKTAFYLYLIAKKKVASFFFQCNGRYGFANFSLYQEFCEIFTDNTKFADDVAFFLARYLTQNKGLKSAEIRLSPSSTYQKCKKKAQEIYFNFEKGLIGTPNEELQYGLVFHFIKQKDTRKIGWFYRQCRHFYFRKEICKKGMAIKKLMKDAPTQLFWKKQLSRKSPYHSYRYHPNMVRGIDAANSEIFTRPEVFAPVFRMLREYVFFDPYQQEKRHLDLGFTYHVGEDFVGAIDGLRAIWEAINYLDFTSGDRFGHCTVLGIDIRSYYHLKSSEITKKKQVLLDDYVFLLTSLQKAGYSDGQLLYNLEFKIKELILYIYEDNTITIDQYRRSMLLRGDEPKHYISIDKYKTRDELKRHCHLLGRDYEIDSTIPGIDMAYSDEKARKLMHRYHYDNVAFKRGEETETVQVDEALTKAVIELQKQIHNLVYEKKIVIETNPTSNYLIGPFNYYDELPIFNFNNFMLYNDGKANEKNIPITICTDDQGIFRTSLVVEYDVIFELLTCNQNPLNKIATVEYEKAYQYIDYLRETSNQVSFVMK